MNTDEHNIPPKVDQAIIALADAILISNAHVHAVEEIADVIRNLVGAVRDQVVEEMGPPGTAIPHLDVLLGDIVVWEHQACRVLNIVPDRAPHETSYEYLLVPLGLKPTERLLAVSSMGRTDLQFRLLKTSPDVPLEGK